VADPSAKLDSLKKHLGVAHAREETALRNYRAAIELRGKYPEMGDTRQASEVRQDLAKIYKAAQEKTKEADLALKTQERLQERAEQKALAAEKEASKQTGRDKAKEKPARGFRRRGRDLERER